MPSGNMSFLEYMTANTPGVSRLVCDAYVMNGKANVIEYWIPADLSSLFFVTEARNAI